MFECEECKKTYSKSKMLGIIVGQIGREKIEAEGLSEFSSNDFFAGILSGFRIKCPNCNKSNWNYK